MTLEADFRYPVRTADELSYLVVAQWRANRLKQRSEIPVRSTELNLSHMIVTVLINVVSPPESESTNSGNGVAPTVIGSS